MEHNHKLKFFIRFLKKNKIYHKFLTNGFSDEGFKKCHNLSLIDFINEQLKRKDWGAVIDDCFTWENTKRVLNIGMMRIADGMTL